MQKGLGFHPGPVDERDWKLGVYVGRMRAEGAHPREKGSQWWYNSLRLDQGTEGACVGFGWTQMANSAPRTHRYDNEFARKVYLRGQYLDPWPETPPEEGTSVRAGAESAKEHGLITGYAYAETVEEIALWVLNEGPVVIGVDWMSGMDRPSKENGYYITATGQIRGGHCTLLDGVNWHGKGNDFFRVLNSWGPEWGYSGRAKIRREDLEALISRPHGTAATSVEV